MRSDIDLPKAALFERIMLPHLDAAYNLARWLTRSTHDADEGVQEAYLRAFRYFDSFTGSDGRTWLLTIVRNSCLDLFRRNKRDVVLFDERLHSSAISHSTPETATRTEAALQTLRPCMEALPTEYRETLVLRELEEFSYKEIADVTALPIGTVMSRLSRARKRLEECMTAKGETI